MSPEAWKQNILEEVSYIADKDFQKKAWFGKSELASSLDEMYCTLVEDFMFEDFLEQHSNLLTKEQLRSGKILLRIFDDYYAKNEPEKAEIVIEDPKWDEVIKAARNFLDSFTEISVTKVQKIACLVCGNETITSRGSFEVCPICFWEEEGVIDDPAVSTGSPNGDLSLNRARKNYKKFGAMEERFIHMVQASLTMPHADILRKYGLAYNIRFGQREVDETSMFIQIKDTIDNDLPSIDVHFVDGNIYAVKFLNNDFFEVDSNKLFNVVQCILAGEYEITTSPFLRRKSIKIRNKAEIILPERVYTDSEYKIHYSRLPKAFMELN